MQKLHRVSAEKVLKNQETTAQQGLSLSEATRRLSVYGPNELIEKGKKKAWRILLAQVKEIMILILLAAVVVSAALQEYVDVIMIFVIVVLNTILGLWQEYKAENAMAILKKMTVPNVWVRPGGTESQILAPEFVPGDILLIETGNIVLADARLIVAANLKVEEAALTGESESVEKATRTLPDDELALANRKNMIYRGTVVTYGRDEAVVTGTGMQTELGKIAAMLQDVEDEQTPLQQRLAKLGRSLAMAAGGLIIGLLSVGTGYWFWSSGTVSNAWQTMVFTMLTFCQMAYALCVRKQTQSLFRQSWLSNPILLLAIGVTLTLQMSLIYVPFLNTVFRTTPLRLEELGVCAAGALVIILITELKKLFLRTRQP